jgi:excisionase family DNA binding protein
MTLREAAAILGLSPETLRSQIRNGRVSASRRGRDWWMTPGSVERYRQEHLGLVGRTEGAKDRVPRKRKATS